MAWIGTRTIPPPLHDLADALGAALVAANVAVDTRPFAPHLTLARRCRGPFPDEPAGPYEWSVDAIALTGPDPASAVLEPAGARYVEVGRWPLRKG